MTSDPISTAAPYAGGYSQHQRELLVSAFLDSNLEDLQAAAQVWLMDADAGGHGVASVAGVEPLLVAAITALQAQADDPAQAHPGSAAASQYVQAIASTGDAALHAALELILGRDPLDQNDPRNTTDPRMEI